MRPLLEGLRTLRRSLVLVPLLLAANLVLAVLLAVPLAVSIERDLENTDAAARMTRGFDYDWWSEWSSRQTGHGRHLSPDTLGFGFAAKNLDLLLKGHLPAGAFARLAGARPRTDNGGKGPEVDPLVLGLGVVSMLVQLFLTGGVLGVFRGAQGRWTVRGLLFGSAFYWGRLVRVALLALLSAGLVFALWAPLSRLAESWARESVSEWSALLWSFARYALLLVALGLVHMASSFAKVILVLENRTSAVLAFVSGASFSLRYLGRAVLQYLAVVLVGGGLLTAWVAVDAAFEPTGYRTQLLFLLLAQGFLGARVALRLWLLASQVALYRSAAGPP